MRKALIVGSCCEWLARDAAVEFQNGRFRPIGHPNHGRKLLWDKNK